MFSRTTRIGIAVASVVWCGHLGVGYASDLQVCDGSDVAFSDDPEPGAQSSNSSFFGPGAHSGGQARSARGKARGRSSLRANNIDDSLFDSALVWPLCGRIADQPPAGWMPWHGCPEERAGDPDHSDHPLGTTFGPRMLAWYGNRYDFHRGIDVYTPHGTPIFAVAAGVVKNAGRVSGYREPMIRIRHYRPGARRCSPNGCYHSLYLHISDLEVVPGQRVAKGQLIGYTGAAASGHEHLHFEIRNARRGDPWSSWQRDAIHPLRVLPYHSHLDAVQADILSVRGTPWRPEVVVKVTQPAELRSMDIDRVEIKIRNNRTRSLVPQPGAEANRSGYRIRPPWVDFQDRNYFYTHKNSWRYPWSSFATCPFGHQHSRWYSADVHVDRRDSRHVTIGDFNGVQVWPAAIGADDQDYELTLRFTDLAGVSSWADLCVAVHVQDARGREDSEERSPSATWNCR